MADDEPLIEASSLGSTGARRLRARTPDHVRTNMRRLLGAEHPDTLRYRAEVAASHRAAGRLDEAIGRGEEVLADSERLLGPEHPDTLRVRADLASSYLAANRLHDATLVAETVLADGERLLGADHPTILAVRADLASCYSLTGRMAEAIALLERVLADSERLLGPDHPATWRARVRLTSLPGSGYIPVVGQDRAVAPTALISWAHDSNDGGQAADEAWKATVLDFMTGLRVHGDVDAHLDVAYSSDPVDWSRWGPDMARRSDFVLVVVNKAWTRRFNGTETPGRGAGAVAEADELLGLFSRDRSTFDRKVIPILLPGASIDDLPDRLRGRLTYYQVRSFDEAGLEPLLRRIHGKPEHPLPPLRGSTPPLPPARQFTAPATQPARSSQRPSPARVATSIQEFTPAPPASEPFGILPEAELRNRLDVVASALRALPPEAGNDNLALPWARQWHQLMAERASIDAELQRRQGREGLVEFVIQQSSDGQYYLQVRHTRNGEVIAVSEAYPRKDDARRVAELLKHSGGTATIVDRTRNSGSG